MNTKLEYMWTKTMKSMKESFVNMINMGMNGNYPSLFPTLSVLE